jgi:hypothetical protein
MDMTFDQYINNIRAEAKNAPRLRKRDIKTMRDVDIYRFQRACEGTVDSRRNTLVELYGERKASGILRELEIRECW